MSGALLAREQRLWPRLQLQTGACALLIAPPRPILPKWTAIVRTLSLSLAAIAAPVIGFGMDIEKTDHGVLCGGPSSPRISVPTGGSPYVDLAADAVTGPFLLDYGETRSSLSAAVFS